MRVTGGTSGFDFVFAGPWLIASLLVGVPIPAHAADARALYGPKHITVHQAKHVVGPTVQIDEQGFLSAAWVEEEQDTRLILFARSEQPGGPLGPPVNVNAPSETPYARQEAPALVVKGTDVFITWAMTHPKMTPDKPFSSELRLSRSGDGGKTFGPSILVNDDAQAINHTFDALHVTSNGDLHLAWIDGREGKKEPGTFVAKSTDGGRSVSRNLKVDENTCVCCRTALATSPDGVIYLAWRKIFEGNVRETVVARSTDGGATFSPPTVVGNDRWVYPACPHRPASLGVDGTGRLYVVWYTEGADETPAVYVAYSDDRGLTFSEKKQLNRSKGTFPDHPQMAVDPAGRVVVVWEEQSPVRREVVLSYSTDRGGSFTAPQKLNEKNGQSPTVAVNQKGTVVLGWKEHAMPAHRIVLQTLELPGGDVVADNGEFRRP
ncbi:MAG TPA: sialidase family protein [Nitrospira sp.]|nr:sialidase family protein [Nitrospira sp.]